MRQEYINKADQIEMEKILTDIDQGNQEKTLNQMKEMESEPINGFSEIKNLIQELSLIRKMYKDTSDTLENVKEKKTQLEQALFIALENAGLQNVKGEDGTTFYRREQFFANVKVQDKPVFFQWLRDNGMGDIIKEDIHSKTLTAFVKEQLEHENPLPDCVNTFTRDTIGYRGGK